MPISKEWFAIHKRPFALEPITGIMMPDGIFDSAISHQRIACHLTNISNKSFLRVRVRIKSVSDSNITLSMQRHDVWQFTAGTSRLLIWDANFSQATPGKHTIEFEVAPWSLLNLSLVKPRVVTQIIFVTQTSYDSVTKRYTCTVPQGQLHLRINSIIVPKKLQKWRNADYAGKHVFLGPILLTDFEAEVIPVASYTGQYGDLPFNDPWWKVVAVVVCVVAFIAAIVAAAAGLGTVYIGMKGEEFVDLDTGQTTCYNCEVDTWGGEEKLSVAGVLSMIAMVALVVALLDEVDPWRRGQQMTPVQPSEQTLAECVRVALNYLGPPTPGKPYAVETQWQYTRTTDTRTLAHKVSETNQNTHYTAGVKIWTSGDSNSTKSPVTVYVQVFRPNQNCYINDELYVYAIVRGPNGLNTRIILRDDGLVPDKAANDGTFTGQFLPDTIATATKRSLKAARGDWSIYVVVQDINGANLAMPPLEAATHIGSYVLHAPFQLSIDGSTPCPDSADATVTIA